VTHAVQAVPVEAIQVEAVRARREPGSLPGPDPAQPSIPSASATNFFCFASCARARPSAGEARSGRAT
jgi:hypothetical protein